MNKILFSEQQKSKSGAWIFFGLHLLCTPFMVIVKDSEATLALMIVSGLFVALAALFWMMRLDTEMNREGVSIKFAPFHRSFRQYLWKDVSKAVVLKHSLGKTGGWGVKYKFQSHNYQKIYSVWGNKYLRIQLNSGRTILIGTQRDMEMEAALNKVMKLNNNEY
jgi:hypothetical protein